MNIFTEAFHYRRNRLDWQKKRNELLALAASWEKTGKQSISRRIRIVMENCAQDLRLLIDRMNCNQ